MPMYNLIECSDNYSKTSTSFCQYYRDDLNDNIAHFESISITGKTSDAGNTKDVTIAVSLNTLVIFGELLKCL